VIVRAAGLLIVREICGLADRVVEGFPESAQVNTMTTAVVVATVGVPVIIPVLPSSARPAGSVPDFTAHVKGAVPPCTKFARLYEKAPPTSPGCGCAGGGLTSVNAGLTVTCTDADLVGSPTEIARIVTVKAALTLAGATY
jgi:hypothetical protein